MAVSKIVEKINPDHSPDFFLPQLPTKQHSVFNVTNH